jgi:diguanylate cyclase (GGDEF)-like protein
MNGLEVCKRIKGAYPEMPVILMTACTQAADIDAAFRAGADDYITKPLQRRELVARVGQAWRLRTETERRLELMQKLRQTNEELERLSALDGLTGLANRRRFDETMKIEWGRAARQREELAIIMLDLDHFKGYNDRYGHPEGDEALRRVAGVLRSVAGRSADLTARYGGEEFVVLLPGTGIEGAVTVAERIRSGVEALDLTIARTRVAAKLTVSLGVAAAVPEPNTDAADLVATADRALYRAKREGRNCIRRATRLGVRPTPYARPERR